MNGEQQKERQTAVAKLERQLKELEESVEDAWKVEVAARVKDCEQTRNMLAEMIDAETQFRKRAIMEAQTAIFNYRKEEYNDLYVSFHQFIQMRWWKRWGWTIFGAQFLVWTAPASLRTAYYAARQQKQKAKETAVMTEDQFRKQQSYTERPQ